MKKLLLLFASVCLVHFLSAQITINGIITDNTDEPLIGATITISEIEGVGAATDIDGTFSLEVPALPVTIVASYIGFIDMTILVTNTDPLDIDLSEGSICKSVETYCSFCCMGPSRMLKLGPSHDFINQSSGITARLQLPYLLKVKPKLYIDGMWNFTNDINNVNLRVERYDMPRFGRVGTSLVGKYRRIDAPDEIDLGLQVIGAQFYYRGFELMIGYANQKNYESINDLLGPKNFSNETNVNQTDGIHVELSKTVFRVFLQSELTYLNGFSQYETRAQYYIPRTRLTVKASYGNISGYQTAMLGVVSTIGLY